MSISKYLQEELGIPDATPGRKCQCPRCGHETFSIKSDDTLAKCFHPSCEEYITIRQLGDSTQAALARILKNFCIEAHQHLLRGGNSAYSYLVDVRKIHSKVIADSMLGIYPDEYNIDTPFDQFVSKTDSKILDLAEKLRESKRKKEQERISEEIDNLEKTRKEIAEYKSKFNEIKEKYKDWLILFHTDSNLNITKLRLRKPMTKNFVTFKFDDVDGVFGLNLYPFTNDTKGKKSLLVTEGEFNSLRLQSLLLYKLEEDSEDLNKVEYFNCISLGSSSDPDLGIVKAIDPNPIINFDSDDAGFSVVNNARRLMHLSAFCVPEPCNDMDEYISTFGNEFDSALEAITKLISEQQYYYRFFGPIIEEIKNIRRSGMKEFEINQRTSEEVLVDLRLRGIFLNDGRTPYFLNKETQKLHSIDTGSIDQVKLLYNYKLNQAEALYKFITNEMIMEAFENGIISDVHRFSFYSKAINTLYLYNNNGKIYKITKTSNDLVYNGTDGVMFIHSSNAEPFELVEVEKKRGIFFDKIIKEVNFDTENSTLTVTEMQLLLKYWIIGIFFESIQPTKALTAFVGEKGSGKSSTFKKIGVAFFGIDFDVMQLPEKPDDLDIALLNEILVVLDNADSKVSWLEDRLATIATGSKIKKRKLYTDSDVVELKPRCFVGITSRNPHFRRDDVAERTLIFKLKRLLSFKSEHEILSEIYEHRNEIISDLVLTIQDILTTMDSDTSYAGDVRMADFASFMVKASEAEGMREVVDSILNKLPRIQAEFAVEVDPLIALLITWCETNSGRYVTYKELWEDLTKIAQEEKIDFYYRVNQRAFANKMASLKSTLEKLFDIGERDKGGHVTERCYKLRGDISLF